MVADYERALSPTGRRQLGVFAIEGYRLVERALAAGVALRVVFAGEDALKAPGERLERLLEKLEQTGCRFVAVPAAVACRLLEGRTFGEVFALAPLPVATGVEVFLEGVRRVSPACRVLVLEELMDPGNVGALLRTAHAFGVSALIALGGTDPFHPRAARTSMGSIFRVPVVRLETHHELMPVLRQLGFLSVGAAIAGGMALPRVRFGAGPVALFAGNEGEGLSETLRAELDRLVAVPMAGGAIDSLSVNAAVAVILYAMGAEAAHG